MNNPLPLPSPRLEPVINYGHIISAAMFAITILTILWWQAGFQTKTEIELQQSRESRAKYIPALEAAIKANDVQDERLRLTGEAMGDIRKTLQSINDKLETTRIDLADIKARLPATASSRK